MVSNNGTHKPTISVADVGCVQEFAYIMEQPGLHVLRGDQGVGKTTILRCVQLATGVPTDVRLTKRDGTPRGEATVAGRTIKITRQVREEGELTIEGPGELNIADLHTPRFIDEKTRDRHRIKALVRLAGVEADTSLFHPLLGGEKPFDLVVSADAMQTDDLVEKAARVKRACEVAAKAEEEKAKTAGANMKAQADQAEGVDLSAPHDEAELSAAFTAEVERRAALRQQRDAADKAMAAAGEARKSMAEHAAPMSVEAATADQERAKTRRSYAISRVEQIEKELADARIELASAEAGLKAADQSLEAARRHADLTAGWTATIEAAERMARPTDAMLAEADAKVKAAADAVTVGVNVRKAIEARDAAVEYAEQAKRHERNAQRLRDAAKDTQNALSDAVARIPDCPLRVRIDDNGDARLVLPTQRGEAENFEELSDGQRWLIVLRLAAAHNRVIVLSQAAFGELSPESRKTLHNLAVQEGCWILTAQATDGPLRGEMFQPEDAEVAAVA